MTQEELESRAHMYAWDTMLDYYMSLTSQELHEELDYLQDIYDKAYQDYIDKHNN